MEKSISANNKQPAHADYGVDAPGVIRNLIIAGTAAILVGLAAGLILQQVFAAVAVIIIVWATVAGTSMLVTAGLMIWSSKRGKLRERDLLIDSLDLRGDETLLDLGCGRGLLLIGAAQRLAKGKAIGVDLWQSADQSGNHPEETRANARAEGVAERVEVITGDMRSLPLADSSVDDLVASLSIHNIPEQAGRARTVQEISRILKAGGRLALLDFQCTDEYVQTLQDIGWNEVERSGLKFQMFPPVRVVTAKKPEGELHEGLADG